MRSKLISFALLLALLVVGVLLAGMRTVASPASPASFSPGLPADGNELLPPGAQVQTVLSDMVDPVAMSFDPQGRLFYTEKSTGQVRLFANGTLAPNPVITFNVDSSGERGLLGITIDPAFNVNHYIYVYYTCGTEAGCTSTQNIVVRFVENNGVGSNPTTIFTSPQIAPNHNGGNIHFGSDSKLYVSVGDNGDANNSQNVTTKNGKIHRINPDGSIPSDNPVFTQTGALPSLYAIGLRNSFDFTFDPLSQKLFASENGPGCDDEMNRIEPGFNYGWRDPYPCDDANPDPTYNTIRPLWYIPNGTCCEAPTGIAFYTGSEIPQWSSDLFMATYSGGNLRHFYLDASRRTVTAVNIVHGVTVNMDIETGPDGALYYIEGGGYSNGTLKRIVGTGPTSTRTSTAVPGTSTPSRTPQLTRTITPTATFGSSTATSTATPTLCPVTFSDVSSSDWFYDYVRCLYCRGAISGYADNTFRPGNNATRGQVAKIVVSAFGVATVTPSTPTFRDVPEGSTFYTSVEAAYTDGLVSGYSCGAPGEPCPGLYFRPNNSVVRGQLSKIVALAAGWELIDPTPATFNDVAPGSPFYEYIETAACRGVIDGYSCGAAGEPCPGRYFRAYASATRAQIAKIVCLSTRSTTPCGGVRK